jgi:hypothetical protein
MLLSFLTPLFNFLFDHSKSDLEKYITVRKPQCLGEVESLERDYIRNINSGGIL